MNEIKEPFRITFEYYDEKIVVERDHSDITADELREMLISAVKASGFDMHIDTIFGESDFDI